MAKTLDKILVVDVEATSFTFDGQNSLSLIRTAESNVTGFSTSGFLNFAIIKREATLDFGPYLLFKYNL